MSSDSKLEELGEILEMVNESGDSRPIDEKEFQKAYSTLERRKYGKDVGILIKIIILLTIVIGFVMIIKWGLGVMKTDDDPVIKVIVVISGLGVVGVLLGGLTYITNISFQRDH